MEQLRGLKQMESSLSLVSDHISVLSSKLEDLLFRAQRIAAAIKKQAASPDSMFGYDLQNFRRDVRNFGTEIGGLSSGFSSLERGGFFEEDAIAPAQAAWRLSDRVHKSLMSLYDKAVVAHQHIRSAEHKVEAWYMVQEIEALIQNTQVLPGIANKVVIVVSTPPKTPDKPEEKV
jgi:hypothetical protein